MTAGLLDLSLPGELLAQARSLGFEVRRTPPGAVDDRRRGLAGERGIRDPGARRGEPRLDLRQFASETVPLAGLDGRVGVGLERRLESAGDDRERARARRERWAG